MFTCKIKLCSHNQQLIDGSKAVVGGPTGPAMAGPLFWPKMVSAGPQFSIIRPKTCLPFQLFLSAVAQLIAQ